VPPQRRKTGPSGPPRRRPKVAGTSRPPRSTPPAEQSAERIVPPTAIPEETRTGQVHLDKAAPEETATAPEAEDTATAPERPVEEVPPAAPQPAAGSEPEPEPESEPETETGAGRSRGWGPVVLLGAVAVALAVVAVIAAFRPGADVSNRAWVDSTATQEVTEAAKSAIEAMHGYDYRTIDEDFARIRELLTPERLEEFDETAEVTKQAAIQTSTVTEVNVLHIGTSMLDDTHAEVAAYINVSATGEGIAQGSAAAPLLVRMEKTDGRWLVSEIRDR